MEEQWSPSQQKKDRDRAKCSRCRSQKQKCVRSDRDWDTTGKKCNNCRKSNSDCGPSYTFEDDPETADKRTSMSTVRHRTSASTSDILPVSESEVSEMSTMASVSGHPFQSSTQHSMQQPALESNANVRVPFDYADSLRARALSRLDDLSALGTVLLSEPRPQSKFCQPSSCFEGVDLASIKHDFQQSFIDLCRMSFEAHHSGFDDMCRWLSYALLVALEKFSLLLNARWQDPLLRIAKLFKTLGHQWEYEHILELMSRAHIITADPIAQSSCLLLAQSLPQTSSSIGRVLRRIWSRTSLNEDAPKDLQLPALHRAAKMMNETVISMVFGQRPDLEPQPLGEDANELMNESMEMVSSRDLWDQTPMMVAASYGRYECCKALSDRGADPNSIDGHWHTPLEMASRNGHIDVVKLLVELKAELDPKYQCCNSSPLQAAIDRDQYNNELVIFLLSQGPDVHVPRPGDSKSALELAGENGYDIEAQGFEHLFMAYGAPGLDLSEFSEPSIRSKEDGTFEYGKEAQLFDTQTYLNENI